MKKIFNILVPVMIFAFIGTINAQELSSGPIPGLNPKKDNTQYIYYNDAANQYFLGDNLAAIGYGYGAQLLQTVSLPLPGGTPFTNLAAFTFPSFASSMTRAGDGNYYITTVYQTTPTAQQPKLYQFDPTTGAVTLLGDITGMGTDSPNGIAYNPNNSVTYLASGASLYSFNIATRAATLIGPFGTGGLMIDLCFDYTGKCYAYDLGTDNAYIVNIATGATTLLGPLGYNANYGQGMGYDFETGWIYLSAYNLTAASGQLRVMDPATGYTNFLASFGANQLAPFEAGTTPAPLPGPGLASGPYPVNGATGVLIPNVTLTWTNPAGAVTNEVWFGTSPGGLSLIQSGTLATSKSVAVAYNTTYYWYVKEIGTGTTQGTLWSFTAEPSPCSVYNAPFTEDIELATFPPNCWSLVLGSTNWIRSTACSGYGTGAASAMADFYNTTGATPFDLITFEFNASTVTNPALKFDYAYATYAGEVDRLDIFYSTNAGTTWTLLLPMPGGTSGILNTGGTVTSTFVPTAAQWATQSLSLPAGTNKIKFQATSAYGNNLYIDNIKVEQGAAVPAFSVLPASKNFGLIATSSPSPNQAFTISNIGGGTLTITGVSITGTNASQFVLTDANTYPINLQAGQTAVVNVKFAPTTTGPKSASLQIIDNLADGTHLVPLTGTGITIPYTGNFDTFTAGQQVACQDSLNWTTWSIDPCSAVEDAYISAAHAYSGTKSALVVQNNDLVKPLGSLSSGSWHISFMNYIPTGKTGYFNTLALFAGGGSLWGMECYFNAGGAGSLLAGGDTTAFTWVPDTWKKVEVFVDLDLDAAEVWYGGTMIFSWQWTLGSGGTGVPLILDANDFFGAAVTDEMYFDDYTIALAANTFPLTVNVAAGWNMVSIPGLLPTNQNVSTWWPGKDPAASVFRFQSGYQPVTVATPGQGYWMKNLAIQTYNTGDEWPAGGINIVAHNPIPGFSGWNIIGGYEQTVNTSGLTTTPPGLITGTIYKYTPGSGYQATTQLVPGFGYWVKLTAAGSINIPPAAEKGIASALNIPESFGRITLTDSRGNSSTLYAADSKTDLSQFDLPPYPPQGMFDVRYTSQRSAETIGTAQEIEMMGVAYPVRIKAENTGIILSDETGKEIARLNSGEEYTVTSAGKLYVSGNVIPLVYSLEQNYPNPFNPSTMIQFSIPEDVQNVKLIVYSSLGEKVAELVNTGLTAGIYKINWNASNIASGLYIYQVVTDKFVATKKMMLLK